MGNLCCGGGNIEVDADEDNYSRSAVDALGMEVLPALDCEEVISEGPSENLNDFERYPRDYGVFLNVFLDEFFLGVDRPEETVHPNSLDEDNSSQYSSCDLEDFALSNPEDISFPFGSVKLPHSLVESFKSPFVPILNSGGGTYVTSNPIPIVPAGTTFTNPVSIIPVENFTDINPIIPGGTFTTTDLITIINGAIFTNTYDPTPTIPGVLTTIDPIPNNLCGTLSTTDPIPLIPCRVFTTTDPIKIIPDEIFTTYPIPTAPLPRIRSRPITIHRKAYP
ncbi:hypothetical protein DMENIID0001_044280 [Sergentomyia squamirostris]